MVVHAAAAGQAPAGLVSLLYEVADDRDLPEAARGEEGRMAWRLRARHRLRDPETAVDRAGDGEIVAVLRACCSARDRLIVLLMARAGLRRGELCGLRRGDVHLLANSRALGCAVERAHLHVVRRDSPNGAWAKSRRQRAVPLDFLVVQAFDTYEFDRMKVPEAAASDFVFVNLFREPLGAPMRPDAIGELMAAASRRQGSTCRSARTNCGTPTEAISLMPERVSMWSRTCSDTHRSRRRRCMCIPTRPGCGPRWTRCPAPVNRRG
jgi:integrase